MKDGWTYYYYSLGVGTSPFSIELTRRGPNLTMYTRPRTGYQAEHHLGCGWHPCRSLGDHYMAYRVFTTFLVCRPLIVSASGSCICHPMCLAFYRCYVEASRTPIYLGSSTTFFTIACSGFRRERPRRKKALVLSLSLL